MDVEEILHNILVGLLVVGLCCLLFLAWRATDTKHVEQQMQDQFSTVSPEAETTAAVTTEVPITTEAPVTTEIPVTTAESVAEIQPAAVLVFGGDVNLDVRYNALVPEAVTDPASCIEEKLLAVMQGADAFMAGNIFAITDTAAPVNKQYTFRTDSENTAFWSKLGADVVSLANNHALDYGAAGLADTMTALDAAGIETVGAGQTIADASAVHYADLGGRRIAFTAAMRSEKYVKTPAATETNAGVMKMYDIEPYLEVIRTADVNADFVVAYVHWGTENTNTLEQAQIDGAHALIDAGADIVIGAHTHTLQAVEYYNGKPIFYSLGDLWCNSLDGESALAKITISENGVTAEVIPCVNTGSRTYVASGDAKTAIFTRLNASDTVTVDENGIVAER